MTDNTQELDETLGKLQEATIVTYAKETLDGVNYRSHHANRAKAKQALLDWHNKQIAKAVSADEFLNYLFRNGHVDREWDAEELEGTLNKLKESK